MNIKQVILPSVLLAGLCLPLNAEVPPYWQDPKANRVNVMPARAAFFAFENASLANQATKPHPIAIFHLKQMEIPFCQGPQPASCRLLQNQL